MIDFEPFSREDLERSIPARFARQVARYSDRMAVSTPEVSYTYRELDELSNGVAWSVHQVLGGAEVPVALMFEQGAMLVVAILGVLKAGKFYVCLDPSEESSRSEFMLTHSGAPLLLTNTAHYVTCSTWATPARAVMSIEPLGGRVDLDIPFGLGPERLAYIFYTSGSTGQPKGVFDNHRNVLHNAMRYTNNLRIAPCDRLTLLQSGTFSATVSSLFCALLNGACVLPIDLRRRGISRTARWFVQAEATIYHSVPAIFEQILASEPEFPSLRVIRLEGDQTFMRHVRLFQARFDARCVLVNGLGATETGISRQHFMRHDSQLEADIVPIGHATEDMELSLLDDQGAKVRIGEIGQIAVSSRYLACGYWQDPQLTRRAFRPSDRDPAGRTYLSGDVGRMRPDGCLEYLGRKDFQVRIRGMTVSVPAVEEALRAVSGIREALVMPTTDRHATRLIGYVVASVSPPPSTGAIRRALAEQLHRPMIPSLYVTLPTLPLDANGKISRRALPASSSARPVLDVAFTPARTDCERRMARLWKEVLELDEVGIHDDFFELGGDSFYAIVLLGLVEKEFRVTLPQSVWLSAQTVAALASAVESTQWSACLVGIRTSGRKPPFFCVHAHNGQVLALASLARRMDPARPFYALQARGLDGTGTLLTSIEEMADQYLREILKVESVGPYHLGGWCFGALIALEMAHRLRTMGKQVGWVIMIDPDPPHTGALSGATSSSGSATNAGRSRMLDRAVEYLRALPEKFRIRSLGTLWHMVGFRRALLPRFLWHTGYYYLHKRAGERHRPHEFDGGVAVICASLTNPDSSDPEKGWSTLLRGPREWVQIPCRGNELFVEPGVRSLARVCDNFLDRWLDSTACHRLEDQGRMSPGTRVAWEADPPDIRPYSTR